MNQREITHCGDNWWAFVLNRQASKHHGLSLLTVFLVRRDSSAVTVTGCVMDHRGTAVQTPAESRDFFIPERFGSGAPTSRKFNG
jgi:hypothetical protein